MDGKSETELRVLFETYPDLKEAYSLTFPKNDIFQEYRQRCSKTLACTMVQQSGRLWL